MTVAEYREELKKFNKADFIAIKPWWNSKMSQGRLTGVFTLCSAPRRGGEDEIMTFADALEALEGMPCDSIVVSSLTGSTYCRKGEALRLVKTVFDCGETVLLLKKSRQ